MNLIQRQHIIIHSIFILCYLISGAIEPFNIISLIVRIVSGLFICFYAVGESLKSALEKYFVFTQRTSWGEFSFNFLMSFSYFMCVSIILSLQYALNSVNLGLAIIFTIVIFDLASLLSNSKLKTERKLTSYRNPLPIVCILYGFSLAILLMKNYSWPSVPGWDIYTHLGNSNWISSHHGTTKIIGGSYSYLFHILIASTSFFVGIDSYTIFWTGPFFAIPFYGLLVYGVSYLLTHERGQSLYASLIALTVCGGGYFLGPQYFFPSTMSILLFLLLLIVILDSQDINRVPSILIYGFILLYYAFYWYPLLITFPIILFFLMRKKAIQSQLNRHSTVIFVLSLIGMILLSALGGPILSSEQTLSLTEKLRMLRDVYPDIFWFLFFLGGFILLFWLPISKSKKRNILPHVLAYTLSLLIIYFLPPLALGRVEIFFRGFLSIIASFTFVLIDHNFTLSHVEISLPIKKHKIHPKKIRIVLSFIIFVLSISFLIQPYISYSDNVSRWSNLSNDEYQAAEWIKQNSLPDDYVLTDPSTGHVFRGLTLRNCSTSFIIKGQSVPAKFSLRMLIYEFFREEDPLKTQSYLEKFPEIPDLIVITTRTSAWVSSERINNTYYAPASETLKSFPGMAKFLTSFFTLLKSWETVKIYRPAEAKIVPVWIDDSFLEGWSWWLGGVYGNYSSATDGDILKVTVQARAPENAWVALRKELPNVSDAAYLKIRYKLDVPCYALRIRLWDHMGRDVTIRYLEQSEEWTEETFPLTKDEAVRISSIGIQIWTQDNFKHVLEVDYTSFLKVVAG